MYSTEVKQEKCEFLLTSVEYLGHRIGKDGIQALKSKTDAIVNAPVPRNVQELRSFLGLLNYYGKFIPNLATVLHPLNSLLRADTKWVWTKECGEAFNQAKLKLTSAEVLAHYDPMLPISLAADASAYGVGAVISHTFPDGSERPIAFASRTLTTSEKNYAQLEKEALSLVFGIKKFHQYLYGRRFTLITDHKPLTTILGPKKGIPSLAAAIDSKDGPYTSQHMTTRSSISLLMHTAMLMVSRDFLSQYQMPPPRVTESAFLTWHRCKHFL